MAVTSARRASELCALRTDEPYLIFHHDKVTLRPDNQFLPKVVTSFHVNQDISLPAFFPRPSTPLEQRLHTLDVRRALAFYTDHTKHLRQTTRLFVCYGPPKLGHPVSTQRLSKWIGQCILLSYQLAGLDPPIAVKAHSTRAMSTSMAFQRGISIPDIRKAATWAKPETFIQHYRLDLRARADCSFGRAMLFSLLA